MSITFVEGDILLSRAQAIGTGFNARGSYEMNPLAAELTYHYPAAYATFRKQVRGGRVQPGDWWIWREAAPWLALLVVRQTHRSAVRNRYVEAAAHRLSRDWQQEGLTRLALTRIGDESEWPAIKELLAYWFSIGGLPVVVYETHRAGIKAQEPWDNNKS